MRSTFGRVQHQPGIYGIFETETGRRWTLGSLPTEFDSVAEAERYIEINLDDELYEPRWLRPPP
jgi:hypothetical protein